ncbi:hypothetical protein KEM56_000654 [Ascosphaera pollenicola]|nr:hypothetical protein KEM56_000654 [Ascosphaera pollenicola]
MKFSVATAITALAGVASARIDAFRVPQTVKPGDTFSVTLVGHNYIQTMYEVAAAFGISSHTYGSYPGTLPTVLDSVYLGPEKSNTIDSYDFPVTIPENTEKGDYTFTVGMFELIGALNSPNAGYMSTNFTVGDETSDNIIVGTYH